MNTVKVYFNDGKCIEYSDSRSGRSYTNHVKYEADVVIVIDVWGKQTAWPLKNVKKVEVIPDRHGMVANNNTPNAANTIPHYSDPKHTPYGASASGSLADLYGFDSVLLNNASGIGMWLYVGLIEQIIRGGWCDNIEVHVISGTGQKGIFMLPWNEVPRGLRIKGSVLYKRPNFDEKRWEYCITDAVF